MIPTGVSPPHLPSMQVVSAARFFIWCDLWTVGIGFSELAGFTSAVGHQEYSFNAKKGNFMTRQFGRPSAPTIALRGGLDQHAFLQLFLWHQLARKNDPTAKLEAVFSILDASGIPAMECRLLEAWCAKLELDAAQAGGSGVVMMKATIECDEIALL